MAATYGDMTINFKLNISPEDQEIIDLLKWLRTQDQGLRFSEEHIKVTLKDTGKRLNVVGDLMISDEGKKIIQEWHRQVETSANYTINTDGTIIDHKSKPAWENM